MRNTRTISAFAIIMFGVPQQSNAQDAYLVTVNTSAINGQSGNVDFQFNPGPSAEPATITIAGFTSDGSIVGMPMNIGDVSGQLPGTVLITNSTGFNDLFQGFTFGNTISFTTDLSGPALTPSPGVFAGSTFSFSLYDQSGVNPLLTVDPSGSVGQIDLNFDGTISTQTFASDPNDDPPVATITPINGSLATPEPSSFFGLVFGLLLLSVAIIKSILMTSKRTYILNRQR
jgi:hypothetical protein